MRRRWFVLLLGLAAGCGGQTSCTIRGKVQVDGKPVEKGVIVFAPASDGGAPVTGGIVNGRYVVRTTAGPKRVQISAPVVTARRPEHPGPGASMVEVTDESLPPKYNSESTLTFDAAVGSITKDWDLESKRGRK